MTTAPMIPTDLNALDLDGLMQLRSSLLSSTQALEDRLNAALRSDSEIERARARRETMLTEPDRLEVDITLKEIERLLVVKREEAIDAKRAARHLRKQKIAQQLPEAAAPFIALMRAIQTEENAEHNEVGFVDRVALPFFCTNDDGLSEVEIYFDRLRERNLIVADAR